ncbi:MAG: zf-HC2 domain-containing protein [Chloroflexota bacterium]
MMNANFGKEGQSAHPPDDAVTCAQVEANLFAYLQNGLPAARQTALRTHIDQCDLCAQVVAEAQLLDRELHTAAARQRRPLPPEASLRIQAQVYRRMRRALFFHRTRDMAQMAGAFALTAVSLLILFLFGSRWVQFVAAPPISEQVIAAATSETAVVTLVEPVEIAPTSLPQRRPTPAVEAVVKTIGERPLPAYLASLSVVTPGKEPDEVAAAVFEATFAGDAARLEQLFSAMRASREPALRLWMRVHSRCVNEVSPATIRYEVVPENPQRIARVDVYENGRYVGELKMRRLNGEWYTIFTTYPSLIGCQLSN